MCLFEDSSYALIKLLFSGDWNVGCGFFKERKTVDEIEMRLYAAAIKSGRNVILFHLGALRNKWKPEGGPKGQA